MVSATSSATSGSADAGSASPEGRLRARDYALLLLFSWTVGLLGIAGSTLESRDEPRVAGISRAMALSGDYVTPRLNLHTFLEYPSLGYVPSALGLRIAGTPSVFAARAPITLLSGGTVCLLAWAGCALGGRRRGLAAGYLLQTTVGFLGLSRMLIVDPVLLFFVTWSLAGFVVAWKRGSRLAAASFWLGMAGGFLSKGLVGVGVPAVSAGGFLALLQLGCWTGRYREPVFRPLGWAWGPLLFAAPIALWMWGVEQSGEGLAREVIRQSVHRFSSAHADHAAPWWAYFRKAPYLTLPLLALVVADGFTARRRGARPAPPLDAGFLFPVASLTLVFVALSVASAKRSLYLGPLYPAAALAGAQLWERIRARLELGVAWERSWLVTVAVVAIGSAWLETRRAIAEGGAPELFAFVQSERHGRDLLLYRPREVMEGAAVFYTGETSEVVHFMHQLPLGRMDRTGAILIEDDRGHDAPLAPSLDGFEVKELARLPFGDSTAIVWSLDPEAK